MDEPGPEAVPPTRRSLFVSFLKIGALGFGGVGPLSRHVLVVERRMLDERSYAETFGIASVLPGANTVNLATMLGDRFRGPTGALVSVLGLLGAPLAILVVAAILYSRYGSEPDVRFGLAGAAAAAAGLVGGTAVRLLRALDPDIVLLAMTAAVCLASAIVKAPMLLILGVAIPTSVTIGVYRSRRRSA